MHLGTPNQAFFSEDVSKFFCSVSQMQRLVLSKIIKQKTNFQKVWLAYVYVGNRESLISRGGENLRPKLVFIKVNAKKRLEFQTVIAEQ